MSLGRKGPKQTSMWVAATDLPRSPGHSFYDKLNGVLEEADFDRKAEAICEPYYARDGSQTQSLLSKRTPI